MWARTQARAPRPLDAGPSTVRADTALSATHPVGPRSRRRPVRQRHLDPHSPRVHPRLGETRAWPTCEGGSLTFVQRISRNLRLNIHYYALALDGLCTPELEFMINPALDDECLLAQWDEWVSRCVRETGGSPMPRDREVIFRAFETIIGQVRGQPEDETRTRELCRDRACPWRLRRSRPKMMRGAVAFAYMRPMLPAKSTTTLARSSSINSRAARSRPASRVRSATCREKVDLTIPSLAVARTVRTRRRGQKNRRSAALRLACSREKA